MGRAEHDSWDLASGVGATATMVAAQRALATRASDALIDDPFADPLVRAVGIDFFIRLLDDEIQIEGADARAALQQTARAVAVRTRFFDGMLTAANAGGVRQIVILAAGLDARAYRLPWTDATVVYEVDQPRVIDFKSSTLARLGARPRAIRRAVGVDLRSDWPTALRGHGFDPQRPTAWIAEGLLIYLPPDAQDRLFDAITALSAPGSRLATEQITDLNVFSDQGLQLATEQLRNEGLDIEMDELVFHGVRHQVADYLESRGWRVQAHPMREAYAANGLALPDGKDAAAFAGMKNIAAVFGDPRP